MAKKKFLFLLILVLQFTVVLAQPCPHPELPNCGGDPGHGRPVPISGIEILLVAGGIMGLRKQMKSSPRK